MLFFLFVVVSLSIRMYIWFAGYVVLCGFIYFCPAYFMAMLTEEEEDNEDI